MKHLARRILRVKKENRKNAHRLHIKAKTLELRLLKNIARLQKAKADYFEVREKLTLPPPPTAAKGKPMKHLAPILKAAKTHLEYCHEIRYNVKTSIYICSAIEKATLAETVDAAYDAIALIGSRLGRYPTAKVWRWPDSSMCPSFAETQAFRHAWLDALIIECETGVRDPNFPAEDLQ